MSLSNLLRATFLTVTFLIIIAVCSNSNNINQHRSRMRTFSKLGPRRIKTPETLNDFIVVVDDDDLFDVSKRQTSEDYGHLRFGKRGEDKFEDYGHMRFGRNN